MKLIQGSKTAGGRNWVQSTLSHAAMAVSLAPRLSARKRLSQFAAEDDGTSTFMTFYVFLAMMIMAGLGIDTMRHEMERTHLQATVDSAVLAGAGAPLGSDVSHVKAVVEDYFTKNDMSEYLHELDTDGEGEDDIVTSLNRTRVFAEASLEMETYLMDLVGVNELKASSAAEAEVRTPKLEVSIVLDVSGSMRGSKLTNLQSAAKEFVTSVLNGSDPGNAVISIVPFSWNVTPGPEIFEALTVDTSHNNTSCLRFVTDDYNQTAIDPDQTYTQQIFTSVYGSFNNINSSKWRSCYPNDSNEILAYSTSETDLHNHIDGLWPAGNTSANIGMKWGAAMLDDEFQEVVDALQEAKMVASGLENLPAKYGEQETLKVIVLMADGQNTNSYYFNANGPWRGPDSDLIQVEWTNQNFVQGYIDYQRGGTGMTNDQTKCGNADYNCIYDASQWPLSGWYLQDGNRYYDVRNQRWLAEWQYNQILSDYSHLIKEGSPRRLTWEEAWGFMSADWHRDITGNQAAYSDYRYQEKEAGWLKDVQMQRICNASKAEDVVIYTIGYNVSSNSNAANQLRNCASTGNHFYRTYGSQITAAFNSIASNVQNLRLTQ